MVMQWSVKIIEIRWQVKQGLFNAVTSSWNNSSSRYYMLFLPSKQCLTWKHRTWSVAGAVGHGCMLGIGSPVHHTGLCSQNSTSYMSSGAHMCINFVTWQLICWQDQNLWSVEMHYGRKNKSSRDEKKQVDVRC